MKLISDGIWVPLPKHRISRFSGEQASKLITTAAPVSGDQFLHVRQPQVLFGLFLLKSDTEEGDSHTRLRAQQILQHVKRNANGRLRDETVQALADLISADDPLLRRRIKLLKKASQNDDDLDDLTIRQLKFDIVCARYVPGANRIIRPEDGLRHTALDVKKSRRRPPFLTVDDRVAAILSKVTMNGSEPVNTELLVDLIPDDDPDLQDRIAKFRKTRGGQSPTTSWIDSKKQIIAQARYVEPLVTARSQKIKKSRTKGRLSLIG